jgi:ATP-dependent DNA helicase RecQ
LVNGYLHKEIESYGVIKLTDKAREFIKNPTSFMMAEDHDYSDDKPTPNTNKGSGSDPKLLKMLKDLRKKVARQKEVPPFVIFQDPSLEDMALKYPINMEEMSYIHGVGESKARKFGKKFIELIERYVEDNDITRPDDLVVKSTGANSANKLYIIQNVDRKLPLNDIANSKGMEMDELIKEMEAIVYSGTKLNISYWIDEHLDEDQQEEIHEYFLEAESDSIDDAIEEFDGDYEDEELRLYRIKFISEVAN